MGKLILRTIDSLNMAHDDFVEIRSQRVVMRRYDICKVTKIPLVYMLAQQHLWPIGILTWKPWNRDTKHHLILSDNSAVLRGSKGK